VHAVTRVSYFKPTFTFKSIDYKTATGNAILRQADGRLLHIVIDE